MFQIYNVNFKNANNFEKTYINLTKILKIH